MSDRATHEPQPDDLRRLLQRCQRIHDRLADAAARCLGVIGTEYAALSYLIDTGAASPGGLGEFLGTSAGGTTALIRRLEEQGLLERLADPDDPRAALVTVSSFGRTRWSECVEPTNATLNGFIQGRPRGELVAATRFLDALARLRPSVAALPENPAPRPSRGTLDVARVAAIVASIPAGRWMSYGDVARASGGTDSHARALNRLFIRHQVVGAHRVLMADGAVSRTALREPTTVRRRLEDEGLRFEHGHAREDARIRAVDVMLDHDAAR